MICSPRRKRGARLSFLVQVVVSLRLGTFQEGRRPRHEIKVRYMNLKNLTNSAICGHPRLCL
jgi:hypothetical protein